MTIDVKMPRLDGFDTVERLRADPRTQDLKIAMVTACAQVDDLRRGDEVGVDAYVTKPFDPTTLVRTVRDLVQHPAT
jgi:CheY-like chemotaxis protein